MGLAGLILLIPVYIVLFDGTEGRAWFQIYPKVPRIYQRAPGGANVCHVNFVDDLTGERSSQYTLNPAGDYSYFVIDRSTGLIQTSTAGITKPVGQTYFITVTGVLGGKTQVLNIPVTVSMRNTNKPVFQKATLKFSVLNTASVSTFVGQVTATVRDTTTYNYILYEPMAPTEPFTLDVYGNIRLAQPLPEDTDEFKLQIRAVDSGTPTLFAYATVKISVIKIALTCYQCKTSDPEDLCLVEQTKTRNTVSCVVGLSKCVIRQTNNTGTNTLTEFERDCEVQLPLVGDKTECFTKDDKRICQVICDTDRCNDVAQIDLEQCIKDDCVSKAPQPGQAKSMLSIVFAVLVVLTLF